MERSTTPVARLHAASKQYGGQPALDGLSLEIHSGEVVALLGVNGAGKSTAISLLLGLQAPDQGEVELFGLAPEQRAARSRIGVMLQSAALPSTLRVAEMLRLTMSYYPAPRAFEETVQLAGIGNLLRSYCSKLSGGQQRRVQFALAICGDPELLFLDEPTTGLDLEAREQLWAAVRRLVAAGRSVLLTTHYLEEAEALADRVVVIGRGKLVAEGSVEAIRSRVAQPRLRARSLLGLEELQAWPEVDEVRRNGDWIELRTAAPEAVLRRWLAADTQLSGLEVRRAGLAEAFTELTRVESAASPGAAS